MSRQFDAAVDVALEIERELRVLTPDRPSLRCFIAECLQRADASYEEVEAQKGALGGGTQLGPFGLRRIRPTPNARWRSAHRADHERRRGIHIQACRRRGAGASARDRGGKACRVSAAPRARDRGEGGMTDPRAYMLIVADAGGDEHPGALPPACRAWGRPYGGSLSRPPVHAWIYTFYSGRDVSRCHGDSAVLQ